MENQTHDTDVQLPEDLSAAQLEQIKNQVLARQQAERTKSREVDLNEVKALIALHGFKWADIKPEVKKASTVAPKYRNPETGDTWTGRGRAPLWIAGQDREQFLIDASEA